MTKRWIPLVLTLCLLFAGCAVPYADKLDLSGKQTNIIANGESEYVIVRSKDGTDYETDIAIDLKDRLERITGVSLRLVNDNKNPAAHEILIGKTVNRPETQEIMNTLQPGDYALVYKNGKLVITATDDLALEELYTLLLRDLLQCEWLTPDENLVKRDTLSIPEKLNFCGHALSKEEFLGQTQLIEYPAYPAQLPRDNNYTVTVTQKDKTITLPVYRSAYLFSEFAFSGEPVTVKIKTSHEYSAYSIQPSFLHSASSQKDKIITFTLDAPADVVISLDDARLFLFAEPPEFAPDLPDKAQSNVLWFDAGYHEIAGDVLEVANDTHVYLAPGALVKARVLVTGSYASVRGRGAFIEPDADRKILTSSSGEQTSNLLQVKGRQNTVSGIKLLNSHNTAIGLVGNEITLQNVKTLVDTPRAGGIQLLHGVRDATVFDCFFMTAHDVVLSGTDAHDITIESCTLGSEKSIFCPQNNVTGENFIARDCDVFAVGEHLFSHSGEGSNYILHDYTLENIRAVDVDFAFPPIYITDCGAGEKHYFFKNLYFSADWQGRSIAEIGADIGGAVFTYENIHVGDRILTADDAIDEGFRNTLTILPE